MAGVHGCARCCCCCCCCTTYYVLGEGSTMQCSPSTNRMVVYCEIAIRSRTVTGAVSRDGANEFSAAASVRRSSAVSDVEWWLFCNCGCVVPDVDGYCLQFGLGENANFETKCVLASIFFGWGMIKQVVLFMVSMDGVLFESVAKGKSA